MTVSRTVYVVDDGADYRFLVQQIFTRFLPEVEAQFFDSGNRLYRHLQTHSVDPDGHQLPGLILLDFEMQGLNGLQVLTLLKQQPGWSQIPVVIMSSLDRRAEIEHAQDVQANSYLIKPTGFNELKQLIQETCQYWLREN